MPRSKVKPVLVPTLAAVAVIAVAAAGLLLVGAEGDSFTPGPGSSGPAAEPVTDLPPASDRERPNVVVISTDDQTLASFNRRTMPRTHDLLVDEGTTFTDAIVVTPTCCPSRASYLTGQYGHNNGILENNPGYVDLRRKGSTLPVWMQQAGYRTIHIGKYLNKFAEAVEDPTEPPPGWEDWRTQISPHAYYDYPLAINGEVVEFGSDDDDYLGRVLTEEAVGAIRSYAPQRRPFFLTLDHFAPHNGGGRGDRRCRKAPVPDPADQRLFEDVELPRPPSFNERDVGDKPRFVRDLEPIGKGPRRQLEQRYQCALASLRSVDRGVEAIYEALADEGELERTVIVFWSDNGYFNGEHRIANKKQLQYEEALRVPLAVRVGTEVDDGRSRRTVRRPVANIDLAPTILDYARGEPCQDGRCRAMDGLSVRGLIRGRAGGVPPRRPLLFEYEKEGNSRYTCAYSGVRTGGLVYIEHTSVPTPGDTRCRPAEESELYDLRADPFQLDNLSPPPRETETARQQARLRRLVDRLRDCRGIRGRDPRPGGGRSYCG
jgi:N-acetylglucosamine-6-sulfatase